MIIYYINNNNNPTIMMDKIRTHQNITKVK